MYGQLFEPLHALLADSTILPNVPSNGHTRKVIKEGPDLKLVARNLLQALAALHENGFVHTGKIVL